MTDFHDDDDYRSRPRARPDPPRSANRQARDSQKRDSQADRGRAPDDELDDWPDEDSDLPDEEQDDLPRRAKQGSSRGETRRDTLMNQRLRVARGEEPDSDFFEDDFDEIDDRRASRGYARSGTGYAPRYKSGGGCGVAILYLTLGAVAIFVLLLLVGRQLIGGVTNNVPAQIRQIVATPTTTVFDRGGTIKQIRDLNRLETNSFSVERVIEANVQRGNLLDYFLGERLLLIASGDAVAGVDMSKLKESDVTISPDGKSITLDLPPSEIFSNRLDNQRTRVYDRQTKLFTQLFGGENKDLETQARQEAESTILQAACEGGIMQKAADEAKRSMEQFLRLLKFQDVRVNSRAGACVAPAQSNAPQPTPTP
ncbi:MAG TPA: DUF4230 domain-containing protein [Roseiflexaceae bacterium]